MSRCSSSSPRYSVETAMPSLLILKISYVFNSKISITLLSFLICLGPSFPKLNAKVMESLIITYVAIDLFVRAFQCLLHHPLHIPCNLLVGDLGIDLCAGNRRMPHHLSDALDRNSRL